MQDLESMIRLVYVYWNQLINYANSEWTFFQ